MKKGWELPEQDHIVYGYSREGSKAALEIGPAMSPSRNTRPREHDAHPNPWFLASGLPRSLAEQRENSLYLRPKNDKNRRCQAVGGLVGHLLVGNVLFWEHQSPLFGPVVSRCGSTRPRGHDAIPNPRFVALDIPYSQTEALK